MGATTFFTRAKGHDAKAAFYAAVEQAQYDYGHSGYTGTIAEKVSFIVIDVPDGTSPAAHAQKLIDEQDRRIDDKWGPAGCIEMPKPNDPDPKTREFLFFGWASD